MNENLVYYLYLCPWANRFSRPNFQAHMFGRKAENHMNLNRFDESIDCHQKAVDCLNEILKTTTQQKSIESLQLQRDYHLKYKELVRMKRTQYERYTRGLHAKNTKSDEMPTCIEKHNVDSVQVQTELYQTLEDTDGLLDNLSQSLRGERTADELEKTAAVKCIKDDLSAIDEMRTLNHQLHLLVFQLVSQLDERNLETTVLRERLKVIEKTNTQPTPSPNVHKLSSKHKLGIVPELNTATPEQMKGITAAVTLCDDYIPSQICELAPLELPKFDLNDFIKKT